MKILLPNKSKKNIIILSILFFVFLASGIFLLWRVNQEERLDPTESEAGSVGSCCCPEGKDCGDLCPSYTICPAGTSCNASSTCTGDCGVCQYDLQGCATGDQFGVPGVYDCAGDPIIDSDQVCYCSEGGCWKKSDLCECMGNCAGEEPLDCTKSKVCEFPESAFLGPGMTSCTCLNWWEQKEAANSVTGSYCTAAPPSCSISQTCAQYDMLDCGISGDGQSKTGCTKMTDASCKSYCSGCDNMSVFYLYCKPEPPPEEEPEPDPVCDGGEWNDGGNPSGVYPYCSEIDLSFDTWDSDGVDKASIAVEVNEDPRVSISKTSVGTGGTEDARVRVEDTLSTETSCLEPGDYTVDAQWADKGGATGSQCTLTTTFTVLEEVKNPDWDITKVPVESCIDENTENPKAKLEYVITIENKGEGTGQIISIVDTLDSKVQEDYIDNISSVGEFSNGEITWTLTGSERDFAPGQSKIYTYSYIVPKDGFGLYENTVEATPVEGNTLIANASITADCLIFEEEPEVPEEEEEPVVPEEEDLPGTGIFDDVQGSLIAGFLLIFLGFTWRFIGRGTILFFNGALEFRKDLIKKRNRRRSLERKKNFEKKVVKD